MIEWKAEKLTDFKKKVIKWFVSKEAEASNTIWVISWWINVFETTFFKPMSTTKSREQWQELNMWWMKTNAASEALQLPSVMSQMYAGFVIEIQSQAWQDQNPWMESLGATIKKMSRNRYIFKHFRDLI